MEQRFLGNVYNRNFHDGYAGGGMGHERHIPNAHDHAGRRATAVYCRRSKR